MRAFKQVLTDLASAAASQKMALAFQSATASRSEREQRCRDMCKSRGVVGVERAAQLLEHVSFLARITTGQFGAYESDQVIAQKLGWRDRYQVRRARQKLIDAGLIETGRGVPPGQKAPVLHYRLTRVFRATWKAVKAFLSKTAQSIGRAVSPNLKALTALFPSKTRQHVNNSPVAAHVLFQSGEKSAGCDRVKASAALSGLKSLLRNR